MGLLCCVLAAGAYVVGGVFMRKAEGFSHVVPSVLVFVCFCLGAALQTVSMRRSELGLNYVVVLGFEAGLAVLLGVAWLGESLSVRKAAGLALVFAGALSLQLEAGSQADGATVVPPAPGRLPSSR